MLLEHAAAHPNDLALDDLVRQRTWGEWLERSRRVAALIRSVVPEERLLRGEGVVASLTGNRVEVFEIALGAALAGVWWAPLDTHRGTRGLAEIVADAEPSLVFVDADRQGDVSGPTVVLGAAYEQALAIEAMSVNLEGRAGGVLRYTSGSTGRPRGVLRHQPETLAHALRHTADRARSFGVPAGPHLVTGPLNHAAPLGFAWMALAVGGSLTLMPRWDAHQALSLMTGRRIASTHLVPTMFQRLLALPSREPITPPERVFHGAAPVSVAVKQAMLDWWGDVLVEYWGCSETGVVTLSESADWRERPGTVGRAVPGVSVFAVDDTGRALTGETGRLRVRREGVSQLFSYWRDPEATAAAHVAPGVIQTGDLGWVEDGAVFLAGRADRVLICGGVNVAPAAVERVLSELEGVTEVRVEGVEDDDLGQVVGVVVAGQVSRDAVAAWCSQRLTGLERPRRITVVAELPRTPAGKLDRERIRSLLRGDMYLR